MYSQRKPGRMHNETYSEKNLYSDQNDRQFEVEDISRYRYRPERSKVRESFHLRQDKASGMWIVKKRLEDKESPVLPSSGPSISLEETVFLNSGRSGSFEELVGEGNTNGGGMPAHESEKTSCLRSPRSEGNQRAFWSQSSSTSACRIGSDADLEIGRRGLTSTPGSSDGIERLWWWKVASDREVGCWDDIDTSQSKVTRPVSEARCYTERIKPRLRNHELETIWDFEGSSRSVAVGSRARAWRSRPMTLSHFEERRTLLGPSSCILPDVECPVCVEVLDETDFSFSSCACGFKLCLFCHHKIAAEDGRCPGCRKPYDPKLTDHENSNLSYEVF